MKNTSILIILDGWGIGENDESNPLFLAKTGTLRTIQSQFSGGALTASGPSIGLSWEAPSTSQIGHYILGTGRNVQKNFPNEIGEQKGTLGEALAKAGKNQMRITESARYREITFFMNGLRETPYENEYRVEIPTSGKSVEENPSLMAEAITDRIMLALNDRGFDFIVANYWNASAAAEAGNLPLAIHAAEIIDREIGKLTKIALAEGHTLILVGSHGNAEEILNPETGKPDTKNNPHPVPFFIVGNQYEKRGKKGEKLETIGILADAAPTILSIMGIQIPPEMTGENILEELV
jgi:2,3-bisphosphoglycerate-independent phosphoglycerate mutase